MQKVISMYDRHAISCYVVGLGPSDRLNGCEEAGSLLLIRRICEIRIDDLGVDAIDLGTRGTVALAAMAAHDMLP